MTVDPKKVVGDIFGKPKGKAGAYDQFLDFPPPGVSPKEWQAYVAEMNAKQGPGLTGAKSLGPGQFKEKRDALYEKFRKDKAAGWKPGGTKPATATTPTSGKPSPAQRIADLTEADKAERQRLLDAYGKAGLVTSQRYQAAAKEGRDIAGAANKQEQDALAQLTTQYFDLNKEDQNALADYLAKTDPYMAEIVAKAADPADLQRMLDSYETEKGAVDKYKELSDPTVTANERFVAEKLRRQFEAQDKSNRMAVSEQMANRGLRSGGQEIAANQSLQQGLAQDRLMNELGIQAGAVDRSMKALEGWQRGANQLGQSANAIADFNQSEQQWRDEWKAKEAKRISDLSKERETTTRTNTKQRGDRDETIYKGGRDVADSTYGRNQDVIAGDIAAADFDYKNSGDYRAKALGDMDTYREQLIASLGLGINEAESELEKEENPPA